MKENEHHDDDSILFVFGEQLVFLSSNQVASMNVA